MNATRIPDMASRCLRQTAHTPSAINELTYEIRDALMAIDPDIKGIGLVWDWDENGENRLRGIVIDRKSAPMVSREGGANA